MIRKAPGGSSSTNPEKQPSNYVRKCVLLFMTGPGSILLVDDDAEIRECLAACLRSEGHLVVEAENGQLALNALASRTTFRLVVLDLRMPVMDGPTFLVGKAKGEHAALPVVIFSSSPYPGLEGLAGVVAVIAKTEGIEILLAAIARADRAAPYGCVPAGGSSG